MVADNRVASTSVNHIKAPPLPQNPPVVTKQRVESAKKGRAQRRPSLRNALAKPEPNQVEEAKEEDNLNFKLPSNRQSHRSKSVMDNAKAAPQQTRHNLDLTNVQSPLRSPADKVTH